MVLDGILIPIDRLAADRPYSGKHRKRGMNPQVIANLKGEILWVSGASPGAVHDLTAARIRGIVCRLAAAGFIVLADKWLHRCRRTRPHPVPAGTNPPRKRPPTAPASGCAPGASGPTPSRGLAPCVNCAATPGAPGSSPKPSISLKPARSLDEKHSVNEDRRIR
jgi:hypothetical protein